MAASLNLIVTLLGNASRLGDDFLSKLSHFAEQEFQRGSQGDIRLNTVYKNFDADGSYSGELRPFELHRILRQAVGDQRADSVRNVGLILADGYAPRPDFLGLMFDREFVPSSNNLRKKAAREGCAVFLNGIQKARQSVAYFYEELLFTSIHELGHVFNLQHDSNPSYMYRSAILAKPLPQNNWRFNSNDILLLKNCSSSKHVFPGATSFGDLGTLSSANTTYGNKLDNNLTLNISSSHEAFYYFEPVQLDIELSRVKNESSNISIPDELDPGYESFQIWIEEPNGARRLYRSPRIYCSQVSTLTLTNSRPSYSRDISIFAESGGYTFRCSGLHRITAIFRTNETGKVVSNTIEVYVKSALLFEGTYEKGKSLYTEVAIALALYHEELPFKRAVGIKRIFDFLEENGNMFECNIVNYNIGRALIKRSTNGASKNLINLAIKSLRVALNSNSLGDERNNKAELALRTLEENLIKVR